MFIRKSEILAVLALVAVWSCAKDNLAPADMAEVRDYAFDVTLPEPAVKTTLGERSDNKYPTLWSEGDCISLNGVLSPALDAAGAGKNVASFRFSGSIVSPYNILYPGTTESSRINLPQEQEYRTGTFDPRNVPMYSSSKEYGNATMKHLCSILKFSIKADTPSKITQIMVMSVGGENLSGTFDLLKDENGLFTGSIKQFDGTGTTALVFGSEGYTLGTTATDFFISIPAGTYSKGFNVLVIDDEDKFMSLAFGTKTPDYVVQPSKVIEFGEFTYEAGAASFLIDDVTDLQTWAANCSAYEEAYIIKDIDMTGQEWTPVPSHTKILNATGHAVKGLTVPFFEKISGGKVSGLTVESDVVETVANKSIGLIARSTEGETVMENCAARGSLKYDAAVSVITYVGGLVGYNTGTLTMSNCVNKANVFTGEASCNKNFFLGGIIGYPGQATGATVTMTKCENIASVKSFLTSTSGTHNIGGVAATLDKTGSSAVSCSNNGEVGYFGSKATALLVGGVFADLGTAANISVSDAANYGQVIVDTPSASTLYAAGVIGRLQNDVENLSNNAEIRVTSQVVSTNAYIGGVVAQQAGTGKMIKSATNSGKVQALGKATTAKYVGGIVAHNRTGNLSSGISARTGSSVEVSVFSGEKKLYIGGITGRDEAKDSQVSGVTANTDLKLNFEVGCTPDEIYIGGICGQYSTSATASLAGCSYTGAISTDGSLVTSSPEIMKRVCIGGIAGKFESTSTSASTSSLSMTGNTSTATITIDNCDGSQYVCCGTLAGDVQAINFEADGNTASGSTSLVGAVDNVAVSGGFGSLYRKGVMNASIKNTESSVNIDVQETLKVCKDPIAGGIVAYAASMSTTNKLSLEIVSCSNSGIITRRMAKELPADLTSEAKAGGIIGAIGYRSDALLDWFDHVSISSCSNSGMIRFNQYTTNPDTGEEEYRDTKNTLCYTGGIVGMSRSVNGGLVTITSCSNSGAMFSTCGHHGGIIGYMHSGTVVTGTKNAYTVNSGDILEKDINTAADLITGSGYNVGGGIAGWLDANDSRNSISWAWNSGNVSSCNLGQANDDGTYTGRPSAGGIVGEINVGGAVTYCKNSGSVRNYYHKNQKSTAFSGAITGSRAFSGETKYTVENCAVGGRCFRAETGWVSADAAKFANLIYCNVDVLSDTQQFPADVFYKGCVYWDGTSKLSWEE